ncbi:MAG: hypothetical protein ISS26_06740 [Candidatus Omnitrophica bacterium]|nr:hypothetical protein [Candidatus Omnitrophota bacterium]
MAQRMELTQRSSRGDIAAPAYFMELQNLLNSPVLIDLFVEIIAVCRENKLITPGLLDAIANGDEVSLKIYILTGEIIDNEDKTEREMAGKRLYGICQLHPDLTNVLIDNLMDRADSIGRRIEILRYMNDITEQILAYEIGVIKEVILDWESDSEVPGDVQLTNIAEYFNIELPLLTQDD